MLDSTLDWLRTHEGPLAYVLLGLAALIEYVFPPFPGDVVAIFGICLALAASYRVWLVYLALVLGAVIGGQTMWLVGRRIGLRGTRPAFLSGPRMAKALDEIQLRFETHGTLFLLVHRFIPSLRALVFVAAGMSGVSFWRTLVLGGISAMLWNAVLLLAGWLVSANWEHLAGLVSAYSTVVVVLVVVGIAVAIWRRRAAKR